MKVAGRCATFSAGLTQTDVLNNYDHVIYLNLSHLLILSKILNQLTQPTSAVHTERNTHGARGQNYKGQYTY